MKIKLHFLLSTLFLLGAYLIKGQTTLSNRGCGSDVLPQQFETWVQSITPITSKNTVGQIQSVFNIPVIVHVIHNNEPINTVNALTGGNLNAAQIIDQINILNRDFNGTNADTVLIPAAFKSVQGKFQFNFCLAVVNPTGGILAEPGIDRINRNTKGWTAPPYSRTYIDGTIKPNSIWDPSRYLNMWVCGISGSILGYATFPNPGTSGLSGLNPPYGSLTTDGLVMRNNAFGSIGTAATGGPYSLGRTTTHEIGHWLGLRHIWGDNGQCSGSDFCNDTPPQRGGTVTPMGANYGCPTFPLHAATCTLGGFSNPNGDMFMNYMDYTNDACMYMFTKDQKNRAQLIMTNSPLRATLLTSTVCNLPSAVNDIGILYVSSPTYSQVINCTTTISPFVVLFNFASNNITSATFSYNVDGVNTSTMAWAGVLAPSTSTTISMPTITNISNGAHIYNVGVYGPNGVADSYTINNVNNQNFSIGGNFSVSITGNTTICQGSTTTLTANSSATNYTWNPGVILNSVAVVNPNSSTVYTLTANNGTCTNTRTVSVITNTFAPICINSPSICSGNSATLIPCGGVSYTITPGGNTIVNPTNTTTYTVLGITSGGCFGTASGTVTVMPLPTLSLAATPATSICAGNSASIFPTGACSYTINSAQPGVPFVVSPLSTTIYTVIGTDCSNGCTGIQTITIPVNNNGITLNISSSSPSVCSGNSATLSVSGGASSFTWNTSANSNSIVVNPSTTTNYSVIGTNGSCTGTAAITISASPLPSLSVSNQTICAGGSATLNAFGTNTYLWDNASTSNSIVVTPSVNTTYTVTGTDFNLCSITETVNVSIGSGLSLNLISNPLSVCAGATATIIATGATSYTWSNGANSHSIIVSPSATTTYSVIGDANFCVGTASITIPLVNAPFITFSVSPSASLCAAIPVTITASGASTYSWNTTSLSNSIIVTPSATTTYSLSSFNGICKADTNIIIYYSTPPSVSISASPSFTICGGQTLSLTAHGTYSQYVWSNSITSPSISVTPSTSTSYTVFASGSAGACSSSAIVTISVSGAAPISSVSVSSSGCGTLCLGSASVITTGGKAPYTYSLSNSSCTSMPCSNLCSGLYKLYTFDSLGCNSFNIFSIAASSNNLYANLTSTNASCNTCNDGMISANSGGGITPYSYTWSPNGGNASTAVGLTAGCYTLDITDSNGCLIKANACIGFITNLEEHLISEALFVYPNPASTNITIEYHESTFNYTIYNNIGQIMSSRKNVHHAALEDVSDYAKGVYFLEIELQTTKTFKKIVVE